MYVTIIYDKKPEDTPDHVDYDLVGGEDTPGYNIELGDDSIVGVFECHGNIRINYEDDGEIECERIEKGDIGDAYTQRMIDLIS